MDILRKIRNTQHLLSAEGGIKMEILRYVLIALEVIASIALIAVVLMQSGKEDGLGAAISGKTDTYMGKNKTGNLDELAAKSTKWIALVWILLALALNLI